MFFYEHLVFIRSWDFLNDTSDIKSRLSSVINNWKQDICISLWIHGFGFPYNQYQITHLNGDLS